MKSILGWFLSLYFQIWDYVHPRTLPTIHNSRIADRYIEAGIEFAVRVYSTEYTQLEVEAALLEWENAEEDYIGRGLRTLPLSSFVEHVRWGLPLKGVNVSRGSNEDPLQHARYYRYFALKRKGLQELTTLIQEEHSRECRYHS